MASLAALRMSWQVPARCSKLVSAAARVPTWQQYRGHRLSPSDDELYQKTTISILEKDSPDMMLVNSYNREGFIINGDKVVGPCVVMPRVILQWNIFPGIPQKRIHGQFTLLIKKITKSEAVVHYYPLCWPGAVPSKVGSYKDICPESLALFYMLEPRIEILVLGLGDRVQRLDPMILKFMRQKGVSVEVQDTPNACATYNFLTSERRLAAAGLIPPLFVETQIE